MRRRKPTIKQAQIEAMLAALPCVKHEQQKR